MKLQLVQKLEKVMECQGVVVDSELQNDCQHVMCDEKFSTS